METAATGALPKAAVHDNPMILPHIIDWHMQVKIEAEASAGNKAPASGDDPLQWEAA